MDVDGPPGTAARLADPKVALPLIALLAVLLRLPGLWVPILDVDESQFAGFAHVLMDGGRPYVDSVDTKPPGIYLFYQAVFTLFGRTNMAALHTVTTLWNVLTALAIFAIGRRIGRSRAGLWAALLFVIFSTTSAPKLTSTSIASIMTLPLVVSFWLLLGLRDGRGRDILRAALSGLLVGVALAFKYQAGVHLPLAVIMTIVLLGPRFLLPTLAFGLAVVGAGLLVYAYLHAYDAVDAFWEWSIVGSLHYLALDSQNLPWVVSLFVRGGRYMLPSLPVWLLSGWFVVVCVRDSLRRRSPAGEELGARIRWLLVAWFGLSFVATSAGGRFYPHYFLQTLPAAALLAALQLERLWPSFFAPRRWARRAWVGMLVIAAVLPAIPRYAYDWFQTNFSDDDPRELMPIVRYLQEHTRPDDPIFIWGFATPIYFYSQRPPGSRFLWADLLTGRAPGPNDPAARNMDTSAHVRSVAWKAFLEDVERHRPVYIIDTSPGNFHMYARFPMTSYPLAAALLKRDYERERAADGVVYYRRKPRAVAE